MAEEQDIPQVASPDEDQTGNDQQPPDKVAQYYDYLKKAGADVAPSLDSFKKTLSSDSTARQYYGYLRQHHFDAPPDYGSFSRTLGIQQPPAQPEHQISHTPIQDIRHLNDLANQPVRSTTTTLDPMSGGSMTDYSQEDIARNKAYLQQYEKGVTDLAGNWGTDPKMTKQAIEDFPDEPDENKLKGFAGLAKDNPVYYGRLKSANDIRLAIAKSGTDGINDANVFNHLQTSANYEELQHNIALQQEIMTKHGLGQPYFEKLKESQAPLVNTLDPGLLVQYWNSDDKKLGLSDFQYAGLETEKLFNPGKYKQDVAIIRHNRGLDQNGGGEATPVPQGKEGYAYDRGVENVLYQLENQGRQNTSKFISQRSAELGPSINQLRDKYQQWINSTNDPLLQKHFLEEFQNDPMLQEAAKLDDGQQAIDYAQSEDQRRFPLNYGDQATRVVKDAMSTTNGWAAVAGKQVLLGAGESADNTMRFIKNTYINLLGSDQLKAENAAANIGHQALTELSGYEGSAFSMQQSPLLIGKGLVDNIQQTFNDGSLTTEQKNQKATELVLNHQGEIKVNPKAGQQNITGKAIIYSAANTIGQILGIADQSLLMGGLLGDAAKAQQMANAVVPMYASTQNQLYEQALARGDEKPLLSSHLDAAIISLASLINPDIKVVKGMVGAETGIGKMIAGVDEATWNKVLTRNRPLVDKMIAGTKATARQLGLANLQYGLIVPTAQYLVHKNVLNEDPNLGDAIKDGLLQTNISMALPALLHGVWGGVEATRVNPTQKFSIVEAGLHTKENVELIDQLAEKGQITPDRADQIKEIIKQTGHILEHTEAVKSDGTWMNEHEVADLTYQMLRKKVLEGKLKNAPDPQKPAIEEKIHEINQSVADLHTSEADKQKTALNQLLTDNLDRIRDKIPTMEGQVREAVKRNEPEQVFKEIYDQATQSKTVDGKEVSSRPAAEETFGKALVEKAIELHSQKPEKNGKADNAHDAQAGNEGQITPEKPQEGAAPGTTGVAEPAASSFINPTDAFRTWNLGDMEGKPEDAAAKKHIEGVVQAWDKHPAGETGGETFGSFVKRVIPAFKSVLESDANNTTIVTHSSVLKAMRVWEEMGRPDVENLTAEQKKEFADKYNAAETHNGDLETFKGANGDIHVIRHGQTEDNAKNNFRSGNTNLTEQGMQDAANVGQELKAKTDGDVPKIITSDLPRAVHTSNLIHDALSVGSPEGEVPRAGTAGENIPAGGEGVGPGQQGQEPAGETGGEGEGQEPPGGAGGPPLSEDNPFRENMEDLPNGIKKAISMSIRAEWKLPEIALPKLGTEDQVLSKGKAAVDSGAIKPREVAQRVAEPGGIYTPEEGGAMLYYGHQLMAAEKEFRADRKEADDLLKKDAGNTAAFYAKITAEQRLGQLDDEIELKTRADRMNSRSWGNLGNVMQIETDETFSPSRVKSTIEENYGGHMPKAVEEKLEKAFAERDEAIAEMKKAKEKVALLEMQKDAGPDKPQQSKVGKMIQEKKEALKKERAQLIEELKQAIKKDSGTLGANPLPIHTVEAVSKLALNYFKDGVVTIEGITNKIYEDLKDVVEGIDKKQIREAIVNYQPLVRAEGTEKSLKKAANLEVDIMRLESRRKTNPDVKLELPEKRPNINFEMDTDYIKAKQRLVNAEFKIKQEKMKSYASQESRLSKTLGWANRLMRLSILSGVKVLEKLAAAATIGSAAQKPVEEILNGIWGQAFPKIAEKADTDMGLNVLATGRYYSHFFNVVEFARDTKDIVSSGETRLGKELEKQHFDHIPILDLPTDLHQVIKGPAKRATFEYALTKILADQQSKGIDINHPLVMESARQRAFARAKYEIFMEDNKISKMFAKWESEWKEQGKLGAGKSFLLHFVFPVSKVPTNIARRVGLSVAGLPIGLVKAAEAYRKGIDNLSTDEANAIGRALTKGSIGIALWTAGFLGYKSLGGLYSSFDPNKQRKNEPLADEMKLLGQPVGKPWQHALPFEVMQLGATFRHIYEKTKTKQSNPIAIAEATMGSAGAILEQIPVVETPVNLAMATQDAYHAKKLGEDLKRRVQPQLLQDLGIIQKDKKAPTGRRPRGEQQ